MKRVLSIAVMGAMCSLAAAAQASASTILFSNQPTDISGTVSDGGTATITGAAIDTVTAIVPAGPQFTVSGTCGTSGTSGCLSLTSGTLLSTSDVAGVTTYTYSPTGSNLTITGTADGSSGTLYTGTFTGNIILEVNDASGIGTIQGTLGGGTLATALAASLFVSPTTTSGSSNDLFVNFTFNSGTGQLTQNQVQVVAAQVPEPASMMLLGSGLLGLYTSARKRFGQKSA